MIGRNQSLWGQVYEKFFLEKYAVEHGPISKTYSISIPDYILKRWLKEMIMLS